MGNIFDSASVVLGVIFFFTYKIMELYVRRKERLSMIDKLSEIRVNGINPNFNFLDSDKGNPYTALRWGSLIFGMGLGLLFAFFILNATAKGQLID